MRRQYSGGEPIDFFIFDKILQCFYHIFERADDLVAQLPYQDLQAAVNKSYTQCNATLAGALHPPTEAEKAAMTAVMNWAKEAPTNPPKYQLALHFDPQYRSTPFLSCFDDSMTTWIKNYEQAQSAHDFRFLAGIFLFIAVAAIVGMLGCFLYRKYQGRKTVWEAMSSPLTLIHHPNGKSESTPLNNFDPSDTIYGV